MKVSVKAMNLIRYVCHNATYCKRKEVADTPFVGIKASSHLKHFLVFAVFVAGMICGWIFFDVQLFSPKPLKNSEQIQYIPVEGQVRPVRVVEAGFSITEKSSPKTILLWTPYFGETYSTDFYFFSNNGSINFKKLRCAYSNCRITINKNYFKEADAILFHLMDMPSLLRYPRLPLKPHQIKIMYNLEAPPTLPKINWYNLRGYFNWTMGYRSDYTLQVKYGDYSYDPHRWSTGNFLKHYANLLQQKRKRAVWFVSHCETFSRREHYFKELKKHYPVDIYGSCGTLYCIPRQSSQCYEDILKNYTFYLSFENTICKDYVTEKFFNPLQYDIVPIVFGGANYDEISPPNSFINAMKYPNPKNLATYLRKVENDPLLYATFFQWKMHFKVHLVPWMCDLCRQLMTFDGHQIVLKNPKDFLVDRAECKEWRNGSFFKM